VVGTDIAGQHRSVHAHLAAGAGEAGNTTLTKNFGMPGGPFMGGSKVLRLELPRLGCVPLVLARATIDRMNVGGSLPAWSPPREDPCGEVPDLPPSRKRRDVCNPSCSETRQRRNDSARTGHSVPRGHDGFAIDR